MNTKQKKGEEKKNDDYYMFLPKYGPTHPIEHGFLWCSGCKTWKFRCDTCGWRQRYYDWKTGEMV